MESQARALNYYTYGSAAPTIQAMVDAETKRVSAPQPKVSLAKDRINRREKAKAATAAKAASGISVFAIFGTLFVAVLMVFVVLAQINYNETVTESARMSILLTELSETHRALELSFERAVDIKEVERFARDELGMSRPDAGQIIIFRSAPRDTAFVLGGGEEREIEGFAQFLRSLTDYFR
jgi:cell division protein FtsL